MKIVQNIEHSYATLDELAAVLPYSFTYMQAQQKAVLGCLSIWGRQTSNPLQRCTHWIATGAVIVALQDHT